MPQAQRDLAELVAFRSVADPRQFPPEECAQGRAWLLDAVRRAPASPDVRLIDTPDGSKAVYGQRPGPGRRADGAALLPLRRAAAAGRRGLAHAAVRADRADGRWYGRGAADCKGNIVMHLTALRALGRRRLPVTSSSIVEGSEEQGTGGLEAFVPEQRRPAARRRHPRLRRRQLRGRRARRHHRACAAWPTSSSPCETLRSPMHSGMFGGAAPGRPRRADPHAGHAARRATATRPSAGSTTTRRGPASTTPPQQFRTDANVLDGVDAARRRHGRRHAVGPAGR